MEPGETGPCRATRSSTWSPRVRDRAAPPVPAAGLQPPHLRRAPDPQLLEVTDQHHPGREPLGTVGRNVCALASWLSNFQGRYDGNLQCASPEYAQGETSWTPCTRSTCARRELSSPAATCSAVTNRSDLGSSAGPPPHSLTTGRGSPTARPSLSPWLSRRTR